MSTRSLVFAPFHSYQTTAVVASAGSEVPTRERSNASRALEPRLTAWIRASFDAGRYCGSACAGCESPSETSKLQAERRSERDKRHDIVDFMGSPCGG